jgi:hypothetical protein
LRSKATQRSGHGRVRRPRTDLGSLLATALTRAHDFLLEPVDSAEQRPSLAGDGSRRPIDVSVLGTCAGCGVTTVASGLTLVMAHDRPQAVVTEVPWPVADVTETGRTVVLVTPGSGHPPIASLVASLLRDRLARLLLVANRVTAEEPWLGQADLFVPESRFGAALVARGRCPPGAFGAALERLAELVEQGPAR